MSKFIFKPFEEMTPEDYATVGFKSGLEVHQQLLTDKKLFCNCPAGHYQDTYNAEILRHMRPTLSELGEYDGTALMEFKTKKDIIYRINYDTVCTYEMDDTPPFQINEQALDIALEVGMLFNGYVVDELHIARKQYLDGSIPTGFQRTAITSVGGFIPYKDRIINLIQMSIEEDSCRETSDIGHKRIYKTDRLGMPLIETVTYPEMKTPQEVAEVNNILRELVRSTGKVRTGIGAGRQDVNVSVKGGTRIEIKGVPNIKRIPLLCYNEAMRQWNLLRLRDELHSRGINEETFTANYIDVTKLLRKTAYQPIHNAIVQGMKVNCVILKGWNGLMNWQTQTDTYFSKEISDRVRVIACLTTLPNIIHSDRWSETIAAADWKNLRKVMNASKDDTLLIVWGADDDAEMGAKEIIIRAKEATIGIPSETRQAHWDGTNGFERILPGPERMYPDTDLPPKPISDERKNRIRSQMPERIWDRTKRYLEIGVPSDIVRDLRISKLANLFDKIVNELKISPKFTAVALIQYPKRLKKMRLSTNAITEEILWNLFKLISEDKISYDSIFPTMKKIAENNNYSDEYLIYKKSDDEIRKIIERTKMIFNEVKINKPEFKEDIFICFLMNELRGKADGNRISEIAKEVLNAEAKK